MYAKPGNGKVTLNWTSPLIVQASQYKIYRYTTSISSQLVTTVSASSSSYVDNSLVNDTTYFYQMTAIDSSGGVGDCSLPVAVVPHVSISGRGVLLDGTSGYVTVPDASPLQISGSAITLEAWVRRDVGDAGYSRIIDKYYYGLYFTGSGFCRSKRMPRCANSQQRQSSYADSSKPGPSCR